MTGHICVTTSDVLEQVGRDAMDRIQAQIRAGAPADTGTPAEKAAHLEGATAMTNTIGGTNEDVSITGTGISHVPLNGQPTFDGLMVDEDGHAVGRIRDGALVIEIGDLDLAIAWRNALQHLCSHLIMHRERKAAKP